ncbi:MAG: O-antigen ligase family protein [Chloroflexus sp.]|jgi:exopolysaccharide production protein ExoQ|nr:O-antigen ligase family protein [Chloroflexus sp.]
MKGFWQRAELIWHVVALTLLSGAFIPLWRDLTFGDPLKRGGDPIQQIVLVAAYSGLLLCWWYRRQMVMAAVKGWLIWLVVGWAIVSVLWSQDSTLTIRRSVTLLLATLYGLFLTVRYPPLTVLRLLGFTMIVILGASLISVALGASWATIDPYYLGSWNGVMFHKNALGRLSVLALLIFGVLFQQTTRPWQVGWAVAGLAGLLLIIGSQSASAIVVLSLVVIAWLMLVLINSLSHQQQLQVAALSLGTAIPVGSLIWFFSAEVAAFLGRDLTLTGRLPLWQALWSIAWKQSLLGYGFGAFWLESGRMIELDIALMRQRFWWALHAHNGYLDIWLEVGLIGLVLTCILLIVALWRSLQMIQRKQAGSYLYFVCLFIIFLLLHNLSEAMLLESSLAKAIFWILLSWSYFSVTQHTDKQNG